jgi:hypothetical protein
MGSVILDGDIASCRHLLPLPPLEALKAIGKSRFRREEFLNPE